MTQSLFLMPELEFSKTAAETTLPDDPNGWQDAILQELFKQVTYLADFDLQVEMSEVDAERGYGLGHVDVSSKTEAPMTADESQQQAAGIRRCRIPIIIKDKKLHPFDLVVTDDSKVLPLTEARLRTAMFRPQNFDVTSKTPGDQSMIGQLYPPFRQNYGFGGGGVAMSAGMGGKTASADSELEAWLLQEVTKQEGTQKEASPAKDAFKAAVSALPSSAKNVAANAAKVPSSTPAEAFAKATAALSKIPKGLPVKKASVLEGILPTANLSDLQAFGAALSDSSTKQAFAVNEATYDALQLIGNARPSSQEKLSAAMQHYLRPSVMQVSLLSDGMYAVKTASHLAWDPRVECVDRGELVQRFGTKLALAVDTNGAATMVPDGQSAQEAPPPGAGAGPISAPGMYQVQSVDGSALTGVVIPNLLDVDGTSLPISLFFDGQQSAVQSDISGVPVGEFSAPGTTPAGQASGYGAFYSDAGGIPTATVPLMLGAAMAPLPGSSDPGQRQAETFDGRQVVVSVQPYVATVVGVEGQMLVPENWCWMPLGQPGDLSLAETAAEVSKVASAEYRRASVEIRAGGVDCYSLRGLPVEKLAASDRDFLNQDQTLFILAGCGADPKVALQKMAQACARTGTVGSIQVPHRLKLASEVRGESRLNAAEHLSNVPVYRKQLWKEAAVIPDPVAVDSVLSLGFLNPENVAAFVGYLPTLDEAQRRLCELLLGARLGLRELSDGALQRAIRALEDTIESLKVLAFQG